jgi:uncharacterized protein YktA (UPF0223 family)
MLASPQVWSNETVCQRMFTLLTGFHTVCAMRESILSSPQEFLRCAEEKLRHRRVHELFNESNGTKLYKGVRTSRDDKGGAE